MADSIEFDLLKDLSCYSSHIKMSQLLSAVGSLTCDITCSDTHVKVAFTVHS